MISNMIDFIIYHIYKNRMRKISVILTTLFGLAGCTSSLPESESNDIKPIISGAQLCAQGILTARHGKQYTVTQDKYKNTLQTCDSAIRALQPKGL